MVNMLQAREIKQAAAAAGFDLCGICRVRNFSAEQTFFEGWLERGFDGGLGYLRRNVEKRFSPAELMPGARSVVVCGVSYKNDTSLGYGDTAVPKVASYARSGDYHVAVKEMLYETAARLGLKEDGTGFRAFTDTARLRSGSRFHRTQYAARLAPLRLFPAARRTGGGCAGRYL